MKKLYRGEKGQLSIFLGIIMMIIITMMAFIINVGLFVKAKINLQNAVDAAAWSGAAVQARQISNIAYVNWEMRNTYKEWMFKYYVIGHLGLSDQLRPQVVAGNSKTSFRLQAFPGSNEVDPYNLPSICMAFGGSKDICKLFSVPGLPRFEAPGLAGIDEQHKSFENTIAKIKADNCSTKSVKNFASAMIWAYGIGNDFFKDTPAAATHRPGAWIQAMELALRMRNLEALVNRPPVDDPICFGSADCTSVESLATESGGGSFGNPYNERPIKAFKSAFRNLSGGAYKSGEIKDGFSSSFKLTELKPKIFDAKNGTLSRMLMPPSPNVNIGSTSFNPAQKRYIDLIAYPLNLVSFYTTMVSSNSSAAIQSIVGSTPTEAACGSTKTGLPVPGYLFGYVKNPKVLTYYAVKGEAKFVGLFYPFSDQEGVTLQAYAAAKPFGGRVGPMLFGFGDENASTIIPRVENAQNRTLPYVSALLVPPGPFKAGRPIPNNQNFWIQSATSVIGGSPAAGIDVKFGIPNILYDYANYGDLAQHTTSTEGAILTVRETTSAIAEPLEELGLYDAKQYSKFASHLQVADPSIVTAMEIEQALESVRQPTKYEALNYMIPTMESGESNPENLATYPVVKPAGQNPATGNTQYRLFGPIWGSDTLYTTPDAIISIIQNYMKSNESAIEKYLDSLKEIAETIAATTSIGTDTYKNAAETIYPLVAGIDNFSNCDSLSMATRFNQFFNGSSAECGIKPLAEMVRDYIKNSTDSGGEMYKYYYTTSYVKPDGGNNLIAPLSNKNMLTSYAPGERQGSNEEGDLLHPFNLYSNILSAKRNYYSTKFVAMEAVAESGQGTYQEKPIYSEAAGSSSGSVSFKIPSDLLSKKIVNELENGQLSDFGELTH